MPKQQKRNARRDNSATKPNATNNATPEPMPEPTPQAAESEAATEAAEKPKRPSHRDAIANESYTGASKPIRRGFRLSPVMLDKACNGLSDRTRLAMLDLRKAYGADAFKRYDYDAGILGFLCYLGYAEHVAGTGSRFNRDGHEYVSGADAEFRLTQAAIDYGNGATKPKAN